MNVPVILPDGQVHWKLHHIWRVLAISPKKNV